MGTPEGTAARELMHAKFDRSLAHERLQKDIAGIERWGPENTNLNDLLAAQELLKSGKPVGPRTYEVAIHAKPEQFLDWDKPLTQQPEGVRSAYADTMLGKSRKDPLIAELLGSKGAVPNEYLGLLEKSQGSQAYNTLGAQSGMIGPSASRYASDALHEAGIPGIRYLDQGSRGATSPTAIDSLKEAIAQREAMEAGNPSFGNRIWLEEARGRLRQAMNPTSNYVVFDPERISILKKYGLAGAVPTMGALAAEDRYAE
jgi:hypothetical protein